MEIKWIDITEALKLFEHGIIDFEDRRKSYEKNRISRLCANLVADISNTAITEPFMEFVLDVARKRMAYEGETIGLKEVELAILEFQVNVNDLLSHIDTASSEEMEVIVQKFSRGFERLQKILRHRLNEIFPGEM